MESKDLINKFGGNF